jgi:uncharacterized protein YkwD
MVRSRRIRGIVARGFVTVLTGCQPGAVTGPQVDPSLQVLEDLVNDHRASVGCQPLTWISEMARVAQEHSEDMARRNFFDHTNPDGLTPFDRMERAGLTATRAAENIAWGQASAQEVLRGWLDSPGHRANLENCQLTEHGLGLYQTRWTHLFRAP